MNGCLCTVALYTLCGASFMNFARYALLRVEVGFGLGVATIISFLTLTTSFYCATGLL